MDISTIDRCLTLLFEVESLLLDHEEDVLVAHLSLVTGRLIDDRAAKWKR